MFGGSLQYWVYCLLLCFCEFVWQHYSATYRLGICTTVLLVIFSGSVCEKMPCSQKTSKKDIVLKKLNFHMDNV